MCTSLPIFGQTLTARVSQALLASLGDILKLNHAILGLTGENILNTWARVHILAPHGD